MRDQAVTKDGQKRYDVVFPKFKKGGYTVRGIKTRCTYGMSVNLIKNKINKTSVKYAFTSCLPRVGGSLRVLRLPSRLKLVAMI